MTSKMTLHEAILKRDVKLVRRLLKEGADVDGYDKNKCCTNVLLHLAAENVDSSEIVKILIDAGADVNGINYMFETALHVAVQHHNIRAIEHLVFSGADVNRQDCDNFTPLHYACRIVQHQSQRVDAYRVVKVLLKHEADANARSVFGETPLHLICRRRNHLPVVKLLLDHDADVNSKDWAGETPLNVAVDYSNLETVQLLLKCGADVNMVCESGATVLHKASVHGSKKVIKTLLESGAEVNAPDSKGQTPLMWALEDWSPETSNRVALLLKTADVNIVDRQGKNILQLTTDDNGRRFILRHLAIMETLNVTMSESLVGTILEQEELSDYFSKCEVELLLAKNAVILRNYSVTFFDFLVEDKAKLVNYAKNKVLCQSFKKSKVERKFPIFGTFMNENLSKAVKKQRLYEDSAASLRNLLPKRANLSHLISEKILYYLEKKDLKNLCQLV